MRPDFEQPSTFRFSTAQFPERERSSLYREIFGRGVVNINMTPLSEDCWAEAELRVLPGASIMWGSNSAHRFEKVRGGPLECDDILLIWTGHSTSGVFRHLGREIPVEKGTAVLMACEHDAVAENFLPISHVNLKLKRSALAPVIAKVEDALMRPILPNVDAMRLLRSYVGSMRTMSCNPTLEQAAVLHLCDLVALSIDATSEMAELAEARGLRAARRDAIRKLVLINLGNPNLSVRDAALSQGVTPRYVQMLFEQEGTTFSAFVLEQRLTLVHRQLSNPQHRGRPIGLMALDAGFGDVSYFNQAFRRRYGEAPSDVRQRAMSNWFDA